MNIEEAKPGVRVTHRDKGYRGTVIGTAPTFPGSTQRLVRWRIDGAELAGLSAPQFLEVDE